jgi:hypothetical protein
VLCCIAAATVLLHSFARVGVSWINFVSKKVVRSILALKQKAAWVVKYAAFFVTLFVDADLLQ